MSDKSFKILVGYHKPFTLYKNEFLIPIHIGRKVSKTITKDGNISDKDYQWLIDNLIGDDIGDNISEKNREYSELTGIYWAWKNYQKIGNPDYIGFMHYRRFLILDEYQYDKHIQTMEEKAYRTYHINCVETDELKSFGYDYDVINEYINKYDLIIPMKSELKLVNVENSRHDYSHPHHGLYIEDYDKLVAAIYKLYPNYKKYIDEQQYTSRRYFYNIFIMKKEIFFDYCKFLFSVVEYLSNIIDVSNYDINAKRTMGYLGESLFDCYIRKLIAESNIKYKELGILNIKLTENNNDNNNNDDIKYKYFFGFGNSKKYFVINFFGIKLTLKK